MPFLHKFLLVWGEANAKTVQAIKPLIPADKLRSCANRSLSDLVAELSQATLFIGHDGGVTHLAAATGIRTLALFRPTDPVTSAPNADHAPSIPTPDRTLTRLTADTRLANLPPPPLES